MPSVAERNAAFDAVKPRVHLLVPAMFQNYIHDDMILAMVDAALNAAERVRQKG